MLESAKLWLNEQESFPILSYHNLCISSCACRTPSILYKDFGLFFWPRAVTSRVELCNKNQMHSPMDCSQVCKGYKKYWKGMEALCLCTFGVEREYRSPWKWSFCLFQFSSVLAMQPTNWKAGNSHRKGRSCVREHPQAGCVAKAEHPPTSQDE